MDGDADHVVGDGPGSLTVERDGKKVTFQLLQGPRFPPRPPELEQLQSLIGKALRAPKQ